jgi:hypothetical protein
MSCSVFLASLAYTSILKMEEQKSSTINKKLSHLKLIVVIVHLLKVYVLAIITTPIKDTAELLSNIWKVFKETICVKLNHTDAGHLQNMSFYSLPV